MPYDKITALNGNNTENGGSPTNTPNLKADRIKLRTTSGCMSKPAMSVSTLKCDARTVKSVFHASAPIKKETGLMILTGFAFESFSANLLQEICIYMDG